MLLMCKNTIVYDIDNNHVYNYMLLPGLMRHSFKQYRLSLEVFKQWAGLRYSSNTNTSARRLKGVTFGQGNRRVIDKVTCSLSLSDCYWLKDINRTVLFEDISPYYSNFWTGKGVYRKGDAIPTLYVGGYLSKEWLSADYLYKYGSNLGIEYEVSCLCKLCDIPVCDIELVNGGIRVKNFTSPSMMLEQADQSGRVDADDFDEYDIVRLFGLFGVQMITIDAITGNGDRHAGNFGWLRDTNTGEYISPAPLYDFDHALDSKLDNDRLIQDVAKVVHYNKGYVDEVKRICNTVLSVSENRVFRRRATTLYNLLNSY